MLKRRLDVNEIDAANVPPATKRKRHGAESHTSDLSSGDTCALLFGSDDGDFAYMRDALVDAAKSRFAKLVRLLVVDGSVRTTASALSLVTDDPVAVGLICSIASDVDAMPSVSKPLRRAALNGDSASIDILVDWRDSDDDIERAIYKLVGRDEGGAVERILTACAWNPSVECHQYGSWVRDALWKAAEDDKPSVAEAIVDMCNDAHDLEEAALLCGARYHGNLDIFKLVWEHAGLCARDFIQLLCDGPARDFLCNEIDNDDYGCHGGCDECTFFDDSDDSDSSNSDDGILADDAPSDCQ